MDFWRSPQIYLRMNKKITEFANPQKTSVAEESNGLLQYLSFNYYKENLDQLGHITRDSINNFLKTISEIEDEFLSILQNQETKELEDNFSFNNRVAYMEENYWSIFLLLVFFCSIGANDLNGTFYIASKLVYA